MVSERRRRPAGSAWRAGVLGAAVLVVAVGPGCVAGPGPDTMAGLDADVFQIPQDPRSSTVRIRAAGCFGMGVGSGFLLDEHTIVTNRHVVEGAERLEVETYEGIDLDVEVASQGTVADLAILKIDEGIGQAADVADHDPPAGARIRAFGYSGGGPMRVTAGRIQGYTEDSELGNEGPVMTAELEIHPGNSGGPVLDDEDQVVGVVYAVEIRSKLALIVPLSTLNDVLDDDDLLQPVEAC